MRHEVFFPVHASELVVAQEREGPATGGACGGLTGTRTGTGKKPGKIGRK